MPRTARIDLRVTPEFKAKLKAEAASADLALNDYLNALLRWNRERLKARRVDGEFYDVEWIRSR